MSGNNFIDIGVILDINENLIINNITDVVEISLHEAALKIAEDLKDEIQKEIKAQDADVSDEGVYHSLVISPVVNSNQSVSVAVYSTAVNMKGKPYARYGVEIGRSGRGEDSGDDEEGDDEGYSGYKPKNPPKEAILQWIIDKPVTPIGERYQTGRKNLEDLAGAIARSIGEKGTKQNAHHVMRTVLGRFRKRKANRENIIARTIRKNFELDEYF